MRSLILPAGLVVCGTLAALPFRRPHSAPTPPPHDDAMPATVTPLSEGPSVGQASAAVDPLSPPQWSTFKRPLPEQDSFGAAPLKLPASYADVAIPLAIEPDPSNLLPQVSAPRGNLSRLSRYGIPLDAYNTPNTDMGWASSGDAQWSIPQTFDSPGAFEGPGTSEGPRTFHRPDQTPTAQAALAQSDAGQPDVPSTQTRPQGKIRAVSQTGSAASRAAANITDEPARRRPHMITEPKSSATRISEPKRSTSSHPIQPRPAESAPAESGPPAPGPAYHWRALSSPKPTSTSSRNYIREPAYPSNGT